jgi:hypothetical protein
MSNSSPKKGRNLQALAYRAIPRQTYHATRNSDTVYKTVLENVRADVTAHHRSVKEWAKSVRVPIYIQNFLTLLNYYSKPEFFNALITVIKHNRKRYDITDAIDYWSEITVYLDDKVLFNNDATEEEQEDAYIALKWPMILRKTFYCLCYKRLKSNFRMTQKDVFADDTDVYMNTGLFRKIVALPDSEILPLIIYSMIDIHSRPNRFKRARIV